MEWVTKIHKYDYRLHITQEIPISENLYAVALGILGERGIVVLRWDGKAG